MAQASSLSSRCRAGAGAGSVSLWVDPSPHASPYPVPPLPLTGTQTRFSQEPADQTVVAGQRAVLPCVLLNYSGIVQWTKDGLALGMGQGLKGEWGHPASRHPDDPICGPPSPFCPRIDSGLGLPSLCPRLFSGVWSALSSPPRFPQTLLFFVSSYGLAQERQ